MELGSIGMEGSMERLLLYGLSAYGLFALARDGGYVQGFFSFIGL